MCVFLVVHLYALRYAMGMKKERGGVCGGNIIEWWCISNVFRRYLGDDLNKDETELIIHNP